MYTANESKVSYSERICSSFLVFVVIIYTFIRDPMLMCMERTLCVFYPCTVHVRCTVYFLYTYRYAYTDIFFIVTPKHVMMCACQCQCKCTRERGD